MNSKEDILETAFLTELTSRYSIEESQLFAYGFNRMQIVRMINGRVQTIPKEEQLKALGLFFLQELHLFKDDNKRIYLGETAFDTSFFYGTALMNIMENLLFRTNLFTEDIPFMIEKNLKQALTMGRKKSQKYRKTAIHQKMVCFYSLEELNLIFKAEPAPVKACDFRIEEEGYFSLLFEEALEREITAFKKEEQTLVEHLEEKVEEYLFRHLELIESGLRPIDRQVVLPNGRMDILARDEKGRDVIIEVKVEEDKDILWQREYYVSEWEKNHHTPRFIVVAPTLKKYIRNALEKIGPTEIRSFEILTKQNAIVGLMLEKPLGIKPYEECIQQTN